MRRLLASTNKSKRRANAARLDFRVDELNATAMATKAKVERAGATETTPAQVEKLARPRGLFELIDWSDA